MITHRPAKATGGYLNGLGNVVPDELMPEQATDDVTAKRLWEASESQIYEWVAANPSRGFSQIKK
jgi:phosphopantetheinyl transferase